MKKLLILLITLLILFGVTGCNSSTLDGNSIPESGKYPTVWNETEFYKSEADIEVDLNKLATWSIEYEKYKGKLNTVEGILGYFETDTNEEYNMCFDRLNSYSNFGTSMYPSEMKYRIVQNKFYEVYNELCERRNFFDEEILNIPLDERIALLSDERLKQYADILYFYTFDNYSNNDDNAQQIYNDATISHGKIRTLFNQFSNIDIPEVEYKRKNGEVVLVSNRTYRALLQDDKYSLQEKYEMNELWWKNASQYKNTLTSMLEIELLEQYSNAKINGFNSTKDEALYNTFAEEDLIQKVLDFGRANANLLSKYYQLLANGEDKYYFYNSFNMLSPFKSDYVPYDKGVDDVITALNCMGEDYIEILTEEFNSGHIDVYPANNKNPGAFEAGNYAGLYPFVMFNYTGTYTDVSTIAHEMGHACYDILCNRNQDYYSWGAATFTHEVASLTNELIYYQYMIDNAKTDEEKLYHLQKMLACWALNIYDSCYWQEFEQYCHELVESGELLDADILTDKWVELGKQYYGDNLDQGEYGKYKWTTLQNIHNNYYEFNYATAMIYATEISNNLRNDAPGARDNYIEFLKTGAAIPSIEALKITGIDVYDDAVYQNAFKFFNEKVEEFETLLKNVKK